MDRIAEIIVLHVLPHFAGHETELQSLKIDLYNLCAYHQVLSRQVLESPGGFEQGRLWLSVSAVVHSYYFCEDRKENCGRQVWKKKEFILDTVSLLDKDQRIDYVQALEAGEFISIRYPDLYWLMERHHVVRQKLDQLARFQQRYYREHIQLLNKPPLERVRQFEAKKPLFAKIASNSIKATHVVLTRQGYENQLKKIRK
ncbi:cyclic nucleotide-binding domain-containing protein [Pedobacter psychroterrae]|uniref:CRP-like cAMP-binding protein n=1 Tax=Pedobacter psychroterrae TaxID=2530453 RepID=A0A4R0NMT9_9SPHI|nr:hypothetical protein [Pedobacter psychroterrae]TCD01238.1 hypothetical protein EZ437_10805 [Pedobacter psychroterrae]